MEPASKATLESCGPACTRQSQAPAAALQAQGTAQPGMLAQGTSSWGHPPAKQGAELSWERQVPAPGMGVHGRHGRRGWQGVLGRKHSLCQELREPESHTGVEARALGCTSSLARRREQLWASLCLL